MRLESWGKSHIGLVRHSNQDHIGLVPEMGLFVVADGMGGHAFGEIASRIAVDTICEEFAGSGHDTGADLERSAQSLFGPQVDQSYRVQHAIERAHETIRRTGRERMSSGQATGPMGSTVVVLSIQSPLARAYWGHVGDSRLYRLRGETLTLLTADDTDPGRRYRGSSDVPLDLAHTNVLRQALGIYSDPVVSLGSDTWLANDVFLLCSDGVSGMVEPSLLRSILASEPTLEDAGEKILASALEAGGVDNASLILVRAMPE